MDRFFALEKKYQLILLAFILVFLVSSGYLTGKTVKAYIGGKDNYAVDTLEIEDSNKGVDVKGKLIVNIKGAVKNPGVYEFVEGDRVNDAIIKAGAADDAATEKLNLAQFLKDEQEIIVPTKEEALQETESKDGLISINSSTREELEKIPGVGPVMAANIITYRESIKGFKKIEELLNVSGIGDKTLEKIKPYIKL